MNLARHALDDATTTFKSMKKLAERAFAQLEPEDYRWVPDPEANSIAIIIKHLYGNMLSRWTDFLTSDGEKADRHRDGEFIDDIPDVEALLQLWEQGWQRLFDTLDSLGEDDLLRTVYIRRQPHTVLEAINRQLSHYAYHVGQIVYIARWRAGSRWQSLSIPRGQSDAYLQHPPAPAK